MKICWLASHETKLASHESKIPRLGGLMATMATTCYGEQEFQIYTFIYKIIIIYIIYIFVNIVPDHYISLYIWEIKSVVILSTYVFLMQNSHKICPGEKLCPG